MESALIAQVLAAIVNPMVVGGAAIISLLLLTGVAARVVERFEQR